MCDELVVFGRGIFLGCVLAAWFDVLRFMRRTWRHSSAFVAVEDFLYWIFAGIAVFVFLERYNTGILRGYILLSGVCGGLIYRGMTRIVTVFIKKDFFHLSQKTGIGRKEKKIDDK